MKAEAKEKQLRNAALIVLLIVIPVQIAGICVIKKMTRGLDSSDFRKFYMPAAESLLQGKSPVIYDGSPMTNVPIGYPSYLAGLLQISRSTGIALDLLIVGGNVIFNCFTILAMFMLAARIGGRKVAIATGLVVGFYPLLMYLSKQGLPQIVCIPFVAWGLYFAHQGYKCKKIWYFGLVGVLFGLGGLVRPAVLPILLVLLVYLLIFCRGPFWLRILRPVLVVFLFVLVVLPWEIHMYRVVGRVVPLSDIASAKKKVDNTATDKPITEQKPAPPTLANTLKTHLEGLREHPMKQIGLLLTDAGKAWYNSRSGKHKAIALLANLPYMLLIPIGFVVAMCRREMRWGGGMSLICLLAMWGLSTITVVLARITSTGVVLSSVISGVAMIWLLELVKILPRTESEEIS